MITVSICLQPSFFRFLLAPPLFLLPLPSLPFHLLLEFSQLCSLCLAPLSLAVLLSARDAQYIHVLYIHSRQCAKVRVQNRVAELVSHFVVSVWIRLATCIFECVLLDILVGQLREMHGKWPVTTCYFVLCKAGSQYDTGETCCITLRLCKSTMQRWNRIIFPA